MMVGGAAAGFPPFVHVLATYLHETAFGHAKYGYGTAIGIVLFALTMLITLISLAVTRRERVEFT
jgi:N-acetylglucosamine transport system permease protein